MTAYIIRRILYTVPQVLGICLLTFLLFEVIYTPRARAVNELQKGASARAIADRIYTRGWGKPLFFNRISSRVQEDDVFDWAKLAAHIVAGRDARERAETLAPAAKLWDALKPMLQPEGSPDAAGQGEDLQLNDVQMARLVDALNRAEQGFLKALPSDILAAPAEPDRIRAEDILDVGKLAEHLRTAKAAQGAHPAALVWDRMPEDVQQMMARLAAPSQGNGETPGGIGPTEKRRALAAINAVIESDDFYRAPEFADMAPQLKDKEDKRIAGVDPTELALRQIRRLNRMALNAALEGQVARRYYSHVTGFGRIVETRFVDHMKKLLLFKFGRSEKTQDLIGRTILRGMVPSLTLTVPIFILSLVVSISLSLGVAYFRGTYLDFWAVVICVAFMSASILLYIIGGQYLLAIHLRVFPVYGYAPGISVVRFLLLPVFIAVLKALGGNVRFYRTILVEEVNRDYVRTARAKGLSERLILFKHVLKNAMIPILTRTILAIPFLFLGSLLLENFFGIPGLGSMTLEAINNGDFQVVVAMVYLGALLFALGNLVTDISYTFVDPRVSLQ